MLASYRTSRRRAGRSETESESSRLALSHSDGARLIKARSCARSFTPTTSPPVVPRNVCLITDTASLSPYYLLFSYQADATRHVLESSMVNKLARQSNNGTILFEPFIVDRIHR